jgi:nucleoside-diphosphate-sugar epimerase
VEDGHAAGDTWGRNSKGVASRARKYLGWKPTGHGLDEEIPKIVEFEGRRMAVEGVPSDEIPG